MDHSEKLLLSKIQQVFLSLGPVEKLLSDLILVNKNFNQITLLENTLHHELILKYPNKIDYNKKFMKYLISQLESHGIEVDEAVYSEYFNLMNNIKEDSCKYYYRHYFLDKKFIVIKNSYSIISEGTTGLSVWEGSIVLAEWCLQNKNRLKNKTILEIGCGVGLTGIMTILFCNVHQYIFTDCNHSVLDMLRHNVGINLGQDDLNMTPTSDNPMDFDSSGFQQSPSNLSDSLWNGSSTSQTDALFNYVCKYKNTCVYIKDYSFDDIAGCAHAISCDILLGSDIIYDDTIFESLINALVNIFKHNPNCLVIVACKIRSLDTLQAFVSLLQKNSMVASRQQLYYERTNLLFHNFDHSQVEIMEIFRFD